MYENQPVPFRGDLIHFLGKHVHLHGGDQSHRHIELGRQLLRLQIVDNVGGAVHEQAVALAGGRPGKGTFLHADALHLHVRGRFSQDAAAASGPDSAAVIFTTSLKSRRQLLMPVVHAGLLRQRSRHGGRRHRG
jgi:hypothetical protein